MVFLLYFHMLERENSVLPLLIRTLIPSWTPPLLSHVELSTAQISTPPKAIQVRGRVLTYMFWGDTNVKSTTYYSLNFVPPLKFSTLDAVFIVTSEKQT
jgi:hypothetical protein